MRNVILSLSPLLAITPASLGQSLFLTNTGELQAVAEILPSNSTSVHLPVVQPGPGSNTATVPSGLASSSVAYSFLDSTNSSKLNMTFSHSCAYPLGGSRAFTYSDAKFTAAGGTAYTMTGMFGPPLGQPATLLQLDASLIATPGGVIFRHATSRSVSGGSFIVLGAAIPGDTLIGSPAGVLQAGVTYTIALNMRTDNQGTVPLSSSGNIAVLLSTGPAPCYANCDASTFAPLLNVNDFNCFVNRYAAGDSYANCDASTIPPILNVVDFLCFMNAYAAGCP